MPGESNACRMEDKLADLEGLVTALRYIGESAADEELAGLRSCAVSLLYLMGDAIRDAQRVAGRCGGNAK